MKDTKIAVLGHIDHGKSTIIGRLLTETNSIPRKKLEDVYDNCKENNRKFEYSYLLDALKEEQSQGITISVARSFLKMKNDSYLLFDVPGHLEFIKSMVTGTSEADGVIMVIDALEGIKENTKVHRIYFVIIGN